MDYTTLPIGQSYEDGIIRRCPKCGQPGLTRTTGGNVFFYHGFGDPYEQGGSTYLELNFCEITNKLPEVKAAGSESSRSAQKSKLAGKARPSKEHRWRV